MNRCESCGRTENEIRLNYAFYDDVCICVECLPGLREYELEESKKAPETQGASQAPYETCPSAAPD